MSAATIVVIGGGPAGAMAAAGLAAAGRPVQLLDEKGAWEKPCGGGITDKALREFPFLGEAGAAANWVRECELTSPGGHTVRFALDRRVAIFARRDLNELLLQRARAAGVEILRARATSVDAGAEGFRIATAGGLNLAAARVVLAGGARLAIRGPWAAGWQPADLMATAGYYVPLERLAWPRERMVIEFAAGLEGYLWSFPRGDHASIGICGALHRESTAALRERLEEFLRRRGVAWHGCGFYAHVLPALRPQAWAALRPEGAGWARVGDAAGLVDPITGEGLYYALRSGAELAAAWSGGGASYAARLEQTVLPELRRAAAIAARFYRGRFAGAAVLDRMAQFTARSPRFRQLMCDLFSGAQGYQGLRRRLYRSLVPSLLEMAFAGD